MLSTTNVPDTTHENKQNGKNCKYVQTASDTEPVTNRLQAV